MTETDQSYLAARAMLDELLQYADGTGRTLFAALLSEAIEVFTPLDKRSTEPLP